MQAIAQNELNSANYGIPENHYDTQTWVNCLDACRLQEGQEFPEPRQLPGIVSSLTKKDLVDTDGESIMLTECGFELWKSEIFISKSAPTHYS